MLRTSQVLGHSAFQIEGLPQQKVQFTSNLLSRKIPILVYGKLRSNAATYTTLKRLQGKLRRRKPAKSETGMLKNNAWTGSVLLQLGELVSTAIRDGRDCKDLEVRKGLYAALRARSNQDLSIGQFEYGLSICSEAESASDVYEIMAGHRSYGDWWRQLGEEVRQRILEERRRAFVAFMAALTPEEKKARRRQLCDELLSEIPELATEIAPTLERSSAYISN